MKRYEDWVERFDAELKKAQLKKWEIGRFTCGFFAADMIKAMTGKDLAEGFRDKFTTEEEEKRYIPDFIKLIYGITKLNNMYKIDVRCAQRGDLVLAEGVHGAATGVVALNGREILLLSKNGITRMPLHCGLKAWKV